MNSLYKNIENVYGRTKYMRIPVYDAPKKTSVEDPTSINRMQCTESKNEMVKDSLLVRNSCIRL